MNPLRLLVLLVSLSLLLGGCGEKESVAYVKPAKPEVEWASLNLNTGPAEEIPVAALEHKVKGNVVTITHYHHFMHISGSELAKMHISGRGTGHWVIPEQIEGKPVTCIGTYSFYTPFSPTHITIPDSVTSIEQNAFQWSKQLVSATIGNSVTSIGNRAFYRCTSLRAVTFLGDAPKAGERVFSESSPTIYRKPEAKGWGDTWGGRPVKLISEKP